MNCSRWLRFAWMAVLRDKPAAHTSKSGLDRAAQILARSRRTNFATVTQDRFMLANSNSRPPTTIRCRSVRRCSTHPPVRRLSTALCYRPSYGLTKVARCGGSPSCGKSPQLWFGASSVSRIRWALDQSLSPSHAPVDHIDVLRYAGGLGRVLLVLFEP